MVELIIKWMASAEQGLMLPTKCHTKMNIFLCVVQEMLCY